MSQLSEAETKECSELSNSATLFQSLDGRIQNWREQLDQKINLHATEMGEIVASFVDEYRKAKVSELKSFADSLNIEECKKGISHIEERVPSTNFEDFKRSLGKAIARKAETEDLNGSTEPSPTRHVDAVMAKCKVLTASKVHSSEVYGIMRDTYDTMNLSWESSGLCYRWESKHLNEASRLSFNKFSACEWLKDNTKVAVGNLEGKLSLIDRNDSCQNIGIQLHGGITRLGHLSRTNQLISLNHSQRIAVWCLDRSKFLFIQPEYSVTDFQVTDKYMALTYQRKAIIKDLVSNESVYTFETPANATTISVSQDETRLIVGCKSGFLRQIDMRTGQVMATVQPTQRSAVQLKATESFGSLACLFSDLTMVVFETSKLQPNKFWSPAYNASAVEWLENGLVTGTEEGDICIRY